MKKLLLLALLLPALAHADSGDVERNAPDKEDYVLVVTIKVKTEQVVDFKTAILDVVDRVHDEDGNLAYIVHQSPTDATDFVIYEHWQTDEAHKNHLNKPFMVDFFKKTGSMAEAGFPSRKKYIDLE
jgi:quinol monooxygenase YgiN